MGCWPAGSDGALALDHAADGATGCCAMGQSGVLCPACPVAAGSGKLPAAPAAATGAVAPTVTPAVPAGAVGCWWVAAGASGEAGQADGRAAPATTGAEGGQAWVGEADAEDSPPAGEDDVLACPQVGAVGGGVGAPAGVSVTAVGAAVGWVALGRSAGVVRAGRVTATAAATAEQAGGAVGLAATCRPA